LTATTNTFPPQALQNGLHTIYFFATDGSDATSINPNVREAGDGIMPDILAPESSPVIGGINAYMFLVKAPPLTFSTSISGRVTAPSGAGLRNVTVSITDASGTPRTATTSSFGFYSFDNVSIQEGQNYTIRVASRLYRFSPRTVNLAGPLTNVDFVGLE